MGTRETIEKHSEAPADIWTWKKWNRKPLHPAIFSKPSCLKDCFAKYVFIVIETLLPKRLLGEVRLHHDRYLEGEGMAVSSGFCNPNLRLSRVSCRSW